MKEVTAFTGSGAPPKRPGIQKGSLGSWGALGTGACLSVSKASVCVCQMLPDVPLHENFPPLLSPAYVAEVSWWNVRNGRVG